MAKNAALITVHGMGNTEYDFDGTLLAKLKTRLKGKFCDLYCDKVFYQLILQENEDRVWDLFKNKLKWDRIREFLLYGFADAAGLENGKERLDSVYSRTQALIAKKLYNAKCELKENGKAVIIAQSLGCQVVSSYLWDAQQAMKWKENQRLLQDETIEGEKKKDLQAKAVKRPTVGIWQNIDNYAKAITGKPTFDPGDVEFIRGDSLAALFTTGCNIPIFVAAHASSDIIPIDKPTQSFVWHNFYDKDDALGWPLYDLYKDAVAADPTNVKAVVTDHPINAGGGLAGFLLKSWNPLSHQQYWKDKDVLDALGGLLLKYLA